VTQALDRVRKAARLKKKERFTALLHHITVDTLQTAFYALRRKAAPGVDGMTWQDYEADLEPRLRELHERVHRGTYRPQPSRRTYIPKADGKQRPLAIATVTSNCTSAPSDFGFDGDNASLSSASWPTIYRPEGQESFWR
jgi:retron-type reverse transcriptase